MKKFFSKNKIFFYFVNFSLIFLYLFPGSLMGYALYGSKQIQPQITPDFIISSNHFYVFVIIAIIGFFTYIKKNQIRFIMFYLISLSIILEIFHLIIPERTFQWSDLFGNLTGVLVVILIKNLINKYEASKK